MRVRLRLQDANGFLRNIEELLVLIRLNEKAGRQAGTDLPKVELCFSRRCQQAQNSVHEASVVEHSSGHHLFRREMLKIG